jgi:hypothetical protein
MDDLPDTPIERVCMVQGILTASATGGGGSGDPHAYQLLRRELMADLGLRDKLPSMVRTYRDLGAFWPYIKQEAGSYAERRQIISAAFTPLLDELEGLHQMPADNHNSTVLSSFDAEGVHTVWAKALDRRASDPEGAITVARTLLETVCKRVLDDRTIVYDDKEDLPKLYGAVAKALNLAPNQHAEEAIKAILGGAMNVVNGIGTLRNKLSDAHGRGGKLPVRPSPRHATLAVNMAGAIAVFIVETHFEQSAAQP